MFEEKAYNSAKAHLRIDIMDLEAEFIEHPSRLQTVVEFAADMMQARDEAATLVKIAVAEAAERLRVADDAGKFPSEAKLSSLSLLDAEVVRANADLAEAERDLRY